MQELADELPISRPAVSRHLRLLKEAGLAADRAEGTRRLYRLHDEGFAAVRAYVERVWGEGAARFRLLAENTTDPAREKEKPMEPIELEFTVACSPEHAFEVWATRTSLWWPSGHSVSADPGLVVTFEPRPEGRIYERTPGGVEHDWGEVVAWEPPRRLVYLWHIAWDRSDATEVEITFRPLGDATSVTIVHRGWERLGARGSELRERNGRAWASLLPHFREACERRAR